MTCLAKRSWGEVTYDPTAVGHPYSHFSAERLLARRNSR
jgi:hypothetical protein